MNSGSTAEHLTIAGLRRTNALAAATTSMEKHKQRKSQGVQPVTSAYCGVLIRGCSPQPLQSRKDLHEWNMSEPMNRTA